MGLFEGYFPYANFHQANLDWLLRTVKELQAQYIELHGELTGFEDWVRNYFANLDISDEVLNVMNIWYDNGRLATLFDSSFVRQYSDADTAMRADTSLAEGMVVRTMGFDQAGDGYGSGYIIASISAPHGVVLANNLRAIPIVENRSVNLKVYDPPTDITQLLQDVLDYQADEVTIPKGNYRLTSQIAVYGHDVRILADSDAFIEAIMIHDPSNDNFAITINGDGRPNPENPDPNLDPVPTWSCEISGGRWEFTTVSSTHIDGKYLINQGLVNIEYCRKAEISDVKGTYARNGKFFNIRACLDVYVHDSYVSNCNASGFAVQNGAVNVKFFNITAEDFDNPFIDGGDPQMWCYPISSGSAAREKIPFVESFIAENVTARNCSWEAVDTHNSRTAVIRNVNAYNCARFIGAYLEENIESPTEGGTLLVENCLYKCEPGVVDVQSFFAGSSSGSNNGYEYDRIAWKNCYLSAKVSQIAGYRYSDVSFEDCTIDFQGAAGSKLRFRDCSLRLSNCVFRNSNSANGLIRADRCLLDIKNCRLEQDQPYSVLNLFDERNTYYGAPPLPSCPTFNCIRYDRQGAVFRASGGSGYCRGLIDTNPSTAHVFFIDGGSLNYGANLAQITGGVDNRSDGMGSYGYGLFQTGSTAQTFQIPTTSGSAIVRIPIATYEVNPCPVPVLPGCVVDIDDGGNTVRNICLSRRVVIERYSDNTQAAFIEFTFAIPFATSSTLTGTFVLANTVAF